MFELIKTRNNNGIDLAKRKLKAKFILGEYHSVQFLLNGSGLYHLFKLRYNNSNGPYFLVKQDSSVFKELKVGDVLDMRYSRPESLGGGKTFKTLITSNIPHDHYAGHSIIELSIIDNQEEK
ncbi:MAG: hypothetical protein JRE65_10945 [Deltaproteobacteria bacterium]|jgi:hypothetical protein|nr:hypothetical protein [Deltaproteobacteria bacterium]